MLLMSEGRDWSLRTFQKNGELGPNLIDKEHELPWEKIINAQELESSLVVLIYSSGTTGLPKGTPIPSRRFLCTYN